MDDPADGNIARWYDNIPGTTPQEEARRARSVNGELGAVANSQATAAEDAKRRAVMTPEQQALQKRNRATADADGEPDEEQSSYKGQYPNKEVSDLRRLLETVRARIATVRQELAAMNLKLTQTTERAAEEGPQKKRKTD